MHVIPLDLGSSVTVSCVNHVLDPLLVERLSNAQHCGHTRPAIGPKACTSASSLGVLSQKGRNRSPLLHSLVLEGCPLFVHIVEHHNHTKYQTCSHDLGAPLGDNSKRLLRRYQTMGGPHCVLRRYQGMAPTTSDPPSTLIV